MAQLVSALVWGTRGRQFESGQPDIFLLKGYFCYFCLRLALFIGGLQGCVLAVGVSAKEGVDGRSSGQKIIFHWLKLL